MGAGFGNEYAGIRAQRVQCLCPFDKGCDIALITGHEDGKGSQAAGGRLFRVDFSKYLRIGDDQYRRTAQGGQSLIQSVRGYAHDQTFFVQQIAYGLVPAAG